MIKFDLNYCQDKYISKEFLNILTALFKENHEIRLEIKEDNIKDSWLQGIFFDLIKHKQFEAKDILRKLSFQVHKTKYGPIRFEAVTSIYDFLYIAQYYKENPKAKLVDDRKGFQKWRQKYDHIHHLTY